MENEERGDSATERGFIPYFSAISFRAETFPRQQSSWGLSIGNSLWDRSVAWQKPFWLLGLRWIIYPPAETFKPPLINTSEQWVILGFRWEDSLMSSLRIIFQLSSNLEIRSFLRCSWFRGSDDFGLSVTEVLEEALTWSDFNYYSSRAPCGSERKLDTSAVSWWKENETDLYSREENLSFPWVLREEDYSEMDHKRGEYQGDR